MALIMCVVGVLTSCSKDDEPEQEQPTITVNGGQSTSLNFEGNFNGKTGVDFKQTVTVVSTVQWTMSKDADWIFVSPSNGNGTTVMNIYPTSANMSPTARHATITLSGSGVSATIEVTEAAGIDANLDVSPNNIITLSDGFAFDYNYGSNVKYYYVRAYLPTSLERKTDDEIIAEMSSDSSNRDTPSDGYVTSWKNLDPLTNYIVCTVGYNQEGKHGALKKTSITTKKGTNQALASIGDVQYNDNYWYWTTSVNGFVSKYYMWFITNSNLYSTTDAAIAWFFDKAMKTNPNDFSPIAQGDSWQRSRNGGTIFHVATWALDVNGNFSGVIGRFAGVVNSAPGKSIKQNYVETSNPFQRFKTMK